MQRHSANRRAVLIAAGILALAGPALPAQDTWQWPEKPQNLKKLPADWPGTRLSPVMRGFTRALGVRCSYCHVGEEGQPLSTYDFASDANPKKEIARKMLDLLGMVNTQLDTLGVAREDRVNMWCHTCHRGAPKPRQLSEELAHEYQLGGADATVAHYRDLHERFAGTWTYDFSRPAVLSTAARALENGKPDDAVTLLRYELELHPTGADVHGSLAKAYAGAGRRELALIHARRALELEPDESSWIELLHSIEAEPTQTPTRQPGAP